MKFENQVENQFRKAGWRKGRDVSNIFNSLNSLDKYPILLKEFIYEYGNLIISDCKDYESDVTTKLDLSSKWFESKNILNELPFNKVLFKIGYFYPDHYMVFMDNQENVYLIGDYYYIIGETLQKGIENLIKDDWKDSLEWNYDLKKWEK